MWCWGLNPRLHACWANILPTELHPFLKARTSFEPHGRQGGAWTKTGSRALSTTRTVSLTLWGRHTQLRLSFSECHTHTVPLWTVPVGVVLLHHGLRTNLLSQTLWPKRQKHGKRWPCRSAHTARVRKRCVASQRRGDMHGSIPGELPRQHCCHSQLRGGLWARH